MWLALGTVTAAQTAPPQPPAKPAAPQPPPQTQKPVFRTGVELLTVDATVVDRDGKQLTDLQMAEFVVEVDGDPRPVVSAEYIKLADDTPVPVGTKRVVAPPPDETYFSTNPVRSRLAA
jgi:hypothetical protein